MNLYIKQIIINQLFRKINPKKFLKINKFIKYIIILFELLSLQIILIFFQKKKYNSNIIKSLKQYLVNELFKKTKKKLTHVDNLYITGERRLGNYLICINNAIVSCELLNCKRLIIKRNNVLFINHTIFDQKYNFIIQPKQTFSYSDKNSLIIDGWFFFYLNFTCLGNSNRLIILKEEILNNLPKLMIHNDDLCIYIRSGDIFSTFKASIYSYSQPPLCFYQNILNNFNFKQVNIISENKLNPVIPILLNNYSFIKYKKKHLKYDVSYLAKSFNIVSAKSSFLTSIIKLNDNLQYLWEYDSCSLTEKYRFIHYSVQRFPYNYTIYKMKPSLRYQKLMFPWNNSKQQRELMIKDKCLNPFEIIMPRF